jgi:hypothetical protein
MTWQGICSACGAPVKGGTDNGTLDLPAGGQKVVCLSCLCFRVEDEEGDGERNPALVGAAGAMGCAEGL